MKRQLTNFAKKTLPFSFRLKLREANWRRKYAVQRKSVPPGTPPVYCPVAQAEFTCFVKQGHDLLTPTNGARARHRLIWLFLERETDLLTRPQRLLHVAPEVCLLPRFSESKTIDYIPGDKFVNGYGKQANVTYLDLLAMDYPSAHFDFVLCNHVLEHIPDDRKAMSELYRTLKPGGTALITVPIKESLPETYENPAVESPDEREKHFGQWDHVRWYGLDIADRLRNVGFTVNMNRYGSSFSASDYKRFGLNDNVLVVCKK